MGYNLRYFTVICLGKMKKQQQQQQQQSQGSRSAIRDLHPVPPECEAEMLCYG
jgi:hypothetical protein